MSGSKARAGWAGMLATIAALAAGAALAQGAPPVRLRGTIETSTGPDLVVRARDGSTVTVRLAEGVRFSAVKRATLADIKAGTYVAIAALPRPDGSQLALEVVIFPEAMRGAGEGHRPWDLMPESTMTNATVAETVTRVDGQVLTLTFKDGRKTVVVPPEAPIVTVVPAERSDAKPGTKVFGSVTRTGTEGPFSAASLVVGKDGIDPPM